MKLVVLIKLIFGFLALSFAVVGLLLPVWPTTPFVLVAIGCFSATPKLRDKLLRVPVFREYYESYTAGKGVCRKTVIGSLVFLWVMLMVSIVVMAKPWATLLLLAVGAAVTVHIHLVSKGKAKPQPVAQNDIDAD